MGNTIGRVFKRYFGKQECRVLMVGLDSAGKTTILYQFKLDELVTTIPTIGFNVETLEHKNVTFTMWDIGGQDKIRALWRLYYQETDGIIFVVDSNDRERIQEAKDELFYLLKDDELKNCLLLVYANKQDLPNVMSTTEITEKLGLMTLRNRNWYIQATSAVNGIGLLEGLEWLGTQIKIRQMNSKSWELQQEITGTPKSSHVAGHIDLGGSIFLSSHLWGQEFLY